MKNQQHCDCRYPAAPRCDVPPCRHPSPAARKAVFLLERVLAQGCIEACQNLTIRLEEGCALQIESIDKIDYESRTQSWDVCRTQRLDAWERQQIPVVLHVRDACGVAHCVRGSLLVCIPLRVLECDCCSGLIQSLLLLKLCSACVVRQCGSNLEIRADVSAHLYLTCMQPQSFCLPSPPSCTFPPLYPQPCTHKKTMCFEH